MAGNTGSLRLYKSYNFVDKDPVIDRLRGAVQDSGKSFADIEGDGGPSATTLYNWFNGKTKRPQFSTIAACMYGVGGKVALVMPDGRVVDVRGGRQIKIGGDA